jgi:hypothetical protein
MLWAMDIATALTVLGLDDRAEWTQIRTAHRHLIRRSHPDAGGSTDIAARVNEAFDVLADATGSGSRSLPPAAVVTQSLKRPSPESAPSVMRGDSPTELLLGLADVGHDIGEVVFVDPLAGLLEIVVGAEPGVGQLTVAVGEPTDDGVSVSFTLEPLGVATAPPIAEVVDDLLRRHRARSIR